MQEQRSCPGCQARMQVMRIGRVELDRCDFCCGIWFDSGELEQVLGHPIVVERTGASRRPCAYCGTLMLIGRIRRVEVDTCASCRGIYLDDGELERIAGLGRTSRPWGAVPASESPENPEVEAERRAWDDAEPNARRSPSSSGASAEGGGRTAIEVVDLLLHIFL